MVIKKHNDIPAGPRHAGAAHIQIVNI